MKLSIPLLSLAATSVLAAPAVVTVTEVAHEHDVKTVRGVVYVQGGETKTSYTTLDDSTPTSVAEPVQENQVQNNAQAPAPSSSSSPTPAPAAAASPSSSSPAAASPSPSPSPAQDSNLSDFAKSMLNEHNIKRALHQDTNPLTWSDELAQYAQNYANNYDCSGNLVHSGGPYGENLAIGYSPVGSVDAWYDEIKDYNYANPGFSESTGHFTQVVWKSSTKVGCAVKSCGGVWGDYVICSYDPAGNFLGEFAQNVAPLK